MSNNRILCVDDEPNVLLAFERQFRRRFNLQTAQGPERALEQLRANGPFAVVVSDLRMPGMDGIQFLSRVREQWPDTVRIMLTGQADLGAAMAAVNEGRIFQFLNKPAPGDMLGRALDAALEQHRLITAERELLEQTLRGSIGVMSDILSLVNPVAFSRAERIRRYVLHIVDARHLSCRWQYELAAMLSQIGCVAVPPTVLKKYYDAQPLTAEEQEMLSAQGSVGYKLLGRIPRLEQVASMVASQSNPPTPGTASETVQIGAQLLRVVLDFDEFVSRGTRPAEALSRMRQHRGYRDEFLGALEDVEVRRADTELLLLPVSKLKSGMITNCTVQTKTGLVIMVVGQEITSSALERLRNFQSTVGIVEPISIRVPKQGLP